MIEFRSFMIPGEVASERLSGYKFFKCKISEVLFMFIHVSIWYENITQTQKALTILFHLALVTHSSSTSGHMYCARERERKYPMA